MTIDQLDRLVSIEKNSVFDTNTIIEREMAAGLNYGPFHRTKVAATKPWHVRKELEYAGYLVDNPNNNDELYRIGKSITNTRGPFQGADIQDMPSGSFTAIATTVTETNLYLISMFAPIPALTMRVGTMYIVEYGGIISTTATPSTQWSGRIGQSATATSNTLISPASTATNAGTGLSSVPMYGRFIVGCRSLGVAASTATLTGNGITIIGNTTAVASQVLAFGGSVLTTIDATANQGLGVSLTWGTNSASNTCTCQWVFMWSRN